MASARPWCVGVIVVLFAVTLTKTAEAQTPPAVPTLPSGQGQLVPGTVVWTFAFEPPLSDDRVAAALTTIVMPKLANAGLARVVASGPAFRLGLVTPADQVPLLLRAAGFAQTPPFVEAGQCRIWAGPDSSGTGASTPAGAAPVLAAAMQEALASLGVQTRRCEPTSDPAQAHLLVWVYGSSPPALPDRREPTFLSWPEYRSPGAVPANVGSPAAGAPRPPATGNAGIVDDPGVRGASGALLMTLALLAGARRLTRSPQIARPR